MKLGTTMFRIGWRGLTPRHAVLLAGALAAVFTAGLWAAPALEASGLPGGDILRAAYRPLCHQVPHRSLDVGGRPLATCARCTGLYAGGTVGLLLAGFLIGKRARSLRPAWLFVAAAPTGLDVFLYLAGWQGLPNGARLALALPAGIVAGVFLASGIADLVSHRTARDASHLVEGADGQSFA